MSKIFFVPLQLSLGTAFYLSASPLLAQVTSDNTVNTQVNQNGNMAEITGGETRGGNLFHSFQDFSVPTGNEAFFNNANEISNIFSRVTGGRISDIDGAIRANGNASLFLINPAGIIFGENARLDIGGSFYSSTASSILFEEGEFSAIDNLSQPVLTINAPIGLGFRDNPGDIVNRSRVENNDEIVGLEISSGNTLAFVGGDINFEAGQATASGGNIYLGGLAEAGIVELNENGSFSFPQDVTLANITLTNGADIDTRGSGGGNIIVDAQNLTLGAGELGRSSIRGGIRPESSNFEAQAGDVIINVAENIRLDDSGIFSSVDFNGEGDAGGITITTTNLNLTNGGFVGAGTFDRGIAGEISITASGDITADGENSGGFSSRIVSLVGSGGLGNTGGVTITTTNLNLMNGGRVDSSTFGEGEAGSIDITATNLNLIDGGSVTASTSGIGNAGEVIIMASEEITVSGEDSEGIPSGIFSQVALDAFGYAGGVTISTTNLSLTNGGQISAETRGVKYAGDVNISSNDLNIKGLKSGIFSRTGGVGDAGTVEINTVNLQIEDDAQIGVNNFVETSLELDTSDPENPRVIRVFDRIEGSGNAGTIEILSDNIELFNGGRIEALSAGGDGGNINLNSNFLSLRNNSNINATAGLEDTPGSGGNININSQFIIAFPEGNNDIIANAFNGSGGNISIASEGIFGIKESSRENLSANDIVASSDTGISGNISITIPDINPVQGVTQLSINPIEPGQTTEQACQANREALAKGGLTIEGKGGIVPEPGMPLNSLNLLSESAPTATPVTPAPIKTSQGKIQPARGIKVTESGDIILTAYPTNNAAERLPEIKQNCG